MKFQVRSHVLWCFTCLAVVLLCAEPAYAHKIKLFATAEGRTISGYAYLSGGGRPKHVPIDVLDPEGKSLLTNVTTDAEGRFSFDATVRCDHLLRIDLGDGHMAQWRIGADELTESLPEAAVGAAVVPDPPSGRDEDARQNDAEADEAGHRVSQTDVQEAVSKAVSREIKPLQRQINVLREQLESYEETIRFRDILGGVGYLVGLAGLAFYFLGAKRMKAINREPDNLSSF